MKREKKKQYYVSTTSVKGKERKVAVNNSPKIRVYPNRYEEDFMDFPVDIVVETAGKVPRIIISGSEGYKIHYNGKELT